MRLVVGARLDFTDAPSLLCFPEDRAAYGRLSQMLTDGKRRAEKGQCRLTLDDLFGAGRRPAADRAATRKAGRRLRRSSAHAEAPLRLHAGAGRASSLSRRRCEADRPTGRPRRRDRRSHGRHQRRACAYRRPPAVAGCADLHPRRLRHRRCRLSPARQRRAPSEIAGRNGAPVPPPAGRRRAHAGDRRCLPLFPRRTEIRIPGRAGAGGPHAAGGIDPADLAARRRTLSGRHSGQGRRPPCTRNWR